MFKSNKLLMILLFCVIAPTVIFASIQTSVQEDTFGLVRVFIIVLFTAMAGLYFIRKNESKKNGKYCISHSIDRDRNLIEYIAL